MERAGSSLTLDKKGRATLLPRGQRWFHHPEMQARIRRAESDFDEGRSTKTKTPAEAQAILDSLKNPPKAG